MKRMLLGLGYRCAWEAYWASFWRKMSSCREPWPPRCEHAEHAQHLLAAIVNLVIWSERESDLVRGSDGVDDFYQHFAGLRPSQRTASLCDGRPQLFRIIERRLRQNGASQHNWPGITAGPWPALLGFDYCRLPD